MVAKMQRVTKNSTKKNTKKASRTTPRVRSLALATLSIDQQADCCANAALILRSAHESAEALLKAYDLARAQRGRPRGMTTDEEQDLLRAMLVMAAAGLDAMIKQLIREALPELLERSDQALNTFEKFIVRRLAEDRDGSGKAANQFLARVLSRPSPKAQLIEEYIQDLTKGSLQSADALFQVAAALGISPPDVGIEPKVLKPIFDIRNMIVHELDINLGANRRSRHVRGQAAMIRDTSALLLLSERILRRVDATLRVAPNIEDRK